MAIDFKKYKNVPKISSAVILASFILPFFLVKCGGTTIASVKGTDLVFGTHIGEAMDPDKGMDLGPRVFGIIAFLIAVLLVVFAWTKFKNVKILSLIFSIAGIVSLIGLYIDLSGIDPPSGGGGRFMQDVQITVGLGFGFYFCILGYIGHAVFHGLWMKDDTPNEPPITQADLDADKEAGVHLGGSDETVDDII